jgi:hypothetical protein
MIPVKIDKVLHHPVWIILDDEGMTIQGVDEGGLFEL